jgi:uncharacterized protein with beta-barrel porin domain
MHRSTLNHSYRLIWSHVQQALVAIAETGKGRGKQGGRSKVLAGSVLAALGLIAQIDAQAACGTISSTTTISGSVTDTCSLAGGTYDLVISNTGSITGFGGLQIFGTYTVDGNIVNNGRIVVDSPMAYYNNSGTLTGMISNSGVMSSYDVAISNQYGDIGGGIINSGTISSTMSGAAPAIFNAQGTIAGIVNSGTIVGASQGINNHASGTITHGISNSGRIAGSVGISNAGLISSTEIGISNSGTISGGVINSGSIAGSNTGFYNSGLILSTSASGLSNSGTISDGISNSGTISGASSGAAGIAGIHASAGLLSNISNSGTIIGRSGIYATGAGTSLSDIINSGSIIATDSNASGLDIVAGSALGSVTNSGTISGNGGIFVDAAGIGAISNQSGGLITGTLVGIMATGNGTISSISNAGTIRGTDAGTSYGIWNNGGTVSGDITNSGTVSGNSSAIYLAGGVISGDVNNSGTITASGSAIYHQNGSINGAISNSGTISGQYGVYNDGGTLSGGITNSGTIVGEIGGLGAAILNSNGSIGHIENSGTLSRDIGIYNYLGTIESLNNTGTVSGSTIGIVNESGTITNGITNSGTIHSDNNAIGASGTIGGITNSGTISGINGIYVEYGTISGDIVNSGTISGAFNSILLLNSVLTGEIIVRGTDTARFIGAVDAPNNAMRVASGASYALVGDEYFSVSSLINNGTLKVADTGSGTATVTGDFSNTGTFNTRVTDTSYGRLAVTGNVALGGTLFVDASTVTSSNTYSSGTLAGVIAGATSSGSFTSYSDNSTLFNFTPVYTSTGFDLTIAAAPGNGVYDAVVNTGNSAGQGAAKVLDRLIQADPAGPIASLFVPLNGNQAISSAVSETLPVLNGGGQQASFSLIRNTTQNIQSRQDAVRGLNSGDDMLTDQHLWFKAFGSWLDQDNRKGVSGYNGNTYGFTAGADGELTEQDRIGAAFTYAKADLNASTNSAVVDLYQLTGYGSHDLNETTWLDYQAGVGQNVNTGDRDIRFANRTAKSDYKSYTANAGVGLSQRIPLAGSTSFIPSVRADYLWLRDESYTEKDAGVLNLKVNSNTADAFIVGLDGKLNHQTEAGYSLTANAGIGYDLIHDRTSITAAYAGALGSSFVTNGIDQSPWIARGGLGVSRDIASGISLQARYDIEHRSDFINQTAALKIRWGF